MRIIFSTGSPPKYMAPPQLADHQVVCGPHWPDAAEDGRVLSLGTAAGPYDLGAVAQRLPPDQQPEAVVCLVDAGLRNLPRNLKSFKCPKVLLVADTHHLQQPIAKMIRYAQSEPFDRVVLLYDRHHEAFFRAAGIRPLFWFPGLTFPHCDRDVLAARSERRSPTIAFVGQAGNYHPRRARLLGALAAAGLPVDIRALPQAASLPFYGASACGFNASLNADLNLRVFEILAAGAALLTDALSPASGFDTLWQENRDVIVYRSAEDLVEKARALSAEPRLADQIGGRGAAWFDAHFREERRRALFRSLVCDGAAPEPFRLPEPRTSVAVPANFFDCAVAAYEQLQETHRTEETVVVAAGPRLPEWVRSLCATLPRLRWAADADMRGAFPASRFHAPEAAPPAREALELGDYEEALKRTQRELLANPASIEALLVLGELARSVRNHKLADKVMAQLAVLAHADPRFRELQGLRPEDAGRRRAPRLLNGAAACRRRGETARGAALAAEALQILRTEIARAPQDAALWRHLAGGLAAEGRDAEALPAFLRARQLGQPEDADREGEQACLARLRQAAAQQGPCDLLLTHVEISRLQGSGVLLQRFFPRGGNFITVRSTSAYGGAVEFPGVHFALDLPGLPAEARVRLLIELLKAFPIRRILCVPFFDADFAHAAAAREATGAPLCVYVMDDQTLYSPGVPLDLARHVFRSARLRLAISPEMASAYGRKFGVPFAILPPIVGEDCPPGLNRWDAARRPASNCAMVGNIWSAGQFGQVRALARALGLQVDWFGNADVPWIAPQREAAETDGIRHRGFLPEAQLARALAHYPFVIVPSGGLDGTEDNEWLTRLSLPSRMVFILSAAATPMLVLGSPETAAARFVARLGIGRSAPYDAAEAAAAIADLTGAERPAFLEALRRHARTFVMPDAGEWIWTSLAAGRPGPTPFAQVWSGAAEPAERMVPLPSTR